MSEDEKLLRRALESISDMIDDVVDQKIMTGRMPNTAAFLQAILDTAQGTLEETNG